MTADIAQAREALVRRRLARRRPTGLRVPPRSERPSLSYAQQRVWFVEQLWPGRSSYVVPVAYRIRGPLDVPALERAIAVVLDRHEALRTRFPVVAGAPYQHVDPEIPGLAVTDLSDRDDPEATALAVTEMYAGLRFDLAEGPLVRAELLRLGPGDHVLLATFHHIVFDGVSLDRFATEVSTVYAGGRPPTLPVQYRDFAAWQREHLDEKRSAGHLAYWRERLAGVPAVLDLPTDRPHPDTPSFSGAVIPLTVPADVTAALREMTRGHSSTLHPIALAAYHAVVARYGAATDVVVVITMAGRVRAEVENLIGFFVNTVPIRAELADDPPFAELVRRVRAAAVEAQAHQELPFDKLVEELAPSRDLSRIPFAQVHFSFVADPDFATLSLPGAEVTDFSRPAAAVRFELELHMRDRGDDLAGELLYATDLFDRGTAERFAEHYLNFLVGVCRDPNQRISQVPITTAEELGLFEQWNDPDSSE
jgi:hypothetical protein